MELTTQFIKTNFDKFNLEYFNGELTTCKFLVMSNKSRLGYYHKGKRLIAISNRYARTEREYQETIIHEMIHAYIHQKGIKDTNTHHGKVFYSIADRINKQGGWNIKRTTNTSHCGLTKPNSETYTMVAIYWKDRNGFVKPHICRISPMKIDYFCNWFNKSSVFGSYFIFETNDDKYCHTPACRTRICGNYITEEEYKRLYQTQRIITYSLTCKQYREMA